MKEMREKNSARFLVYVDEGAQEIKSCGSAFFFALEHNFREYIKTCTKNLQFYICVIVTHLSC